MMLCPELDKIVMNQKFEIYSTTGIYRIVFGYIYLSEVTWRGL